ncbi:MAG: TRL-like family protein [Deltaproteobacteria bacterium]|nr:TRL-like family protein [Deltaproteobacteria bacterium]
MYKLVALSLLLVFTGCTTVPAPVMGILYTDVKFPSDAPNSAKVVEKKGEACATTILGLVATGDASLASAAAEAKITQITAVDYHSTNILMLYGKFCTIVRGE